MASQGYAKEQPQGFKNHIENVAIVGAGGQSGKFIVEELLKQGKHNITAITRPDSTNKILTGVTVKKVDYNDSASLTEALKGQDALVITMAVTAPPDTQDKLISAAAAAGVPWIFPNEFGGDGVNEQAGKDIFLGPPKQKVREYIESLGVSSWVGIGCGFWYEYSLAGGPERFGFDFKKKSVTFFGDGTQKLSTSTWPQTGRFVARLLALPLLPNDASDKSTTLDGYRNKFACVASFTITQKEMFDSVLRVTGGKAEDWNVTSEPVKERFEEGVKELQSGNRMGFAKLLYSRMFFPDAPMDFEKSLGVDNTKLDLPVEDLDEFTKVALGLVESGYFEQQGA